MARKFENTTSMDGTSAAFPAALPVVLVAAVEAPVVDNVIITSAELGVLKKLLDIDRASAIVHGGLKSLLSLSDDDAKVLLSFLKRV